MLQMPSILALCTLFFLVSAIDVGCGLVGFLKQFLNLGLSTFNHVLIDLLFVANNIFRSNYSTTGWTVVVDIHLLLVILSHIDDLWRSTHLVHQRCLLQVPLHQLLLEHGARLVEG